MGSSRRAGSRRRRTSQPMHRYHRVRDKQRLAVKPPIKFKTKGFLTGAELARRRGVVVGRPGSQRPRPRVGTRGEFQPVACRSSSRRAMDRVRCGSPSMASDQSLFLRLLQQGSYTAQCQPVPGTRPPEQYERGDTSVGSAVKQQVGVGGRRQMHRREMKIFSTEVVSHRE